MIADFGVFVLFAAAGTAIGTGIGACAAYILFAQQFRRSRAIERALLALVNRMDEIVKQGVDPTPSQPKETTDDVHTAQGPIFWPFNDGDGFNPFGRRH